MRITPDSELEHLKDEEYLIFRAKEEQLCNPFAAKSWLITAQTIFPKNFGIQFEIYKIAKNEKNVKEAANCLTTLFQNFCNETALWVEIDAIMSVLCDPPVQNVSHTPFISQIFYKLPKETQKALVLSAAERSKDTMTYVSLMLLLTSSFPENTAYNGLTLVDALLKAEKPTHGPLNPYRRKLVCDLLPRLLQAEGLEVRPKTLYTLLTKSIEFYVAYCTTPLKVIHIKLETDSEIEDPWQDLFSIVRLIGWNLGWSLASEFDTVSNRELILQKIQNMVEGGARLGGPKDNGDDVREILFITITIFLQALLDYSRRLCPDFAQGENPNSYPPPLTLVEAFTKPERDEMLSSPRGFASPPSKVLLSPPTKRLRPSIEEEQSPAFITVSKLSCQSSPTSAGSGGETLGSVGGAAPILFGGSSLPHSNVSSGALSQALITAIKCWNLLHAYESLRGEFVRILEGLTIEKWLIVFNMDVLIYEGRLIEAENQLRHTMVRALQSKQNNSPLTILTLNLKLASVLFSLNKFSAATESAIEVVEQIRPLSTQGGLTPNLVVPTLPVRRHLHLLALTQSQCLQFITTLLIYSLRNLIIVEGNTDDLCLGHLIVMLQFEWPRHLHIFEEVIDVIRKKCGFAYQYFAPYVTTADMLEEFMFLANSLGAGFQLDILPLPHTSKQQRMSTRGADRGSKQDFKAAMKKQMLRCYESVETNLITFLTRQGAYIPPVFM